MIVMIWLYERGYYLPSLHKMICRPLFGYPSAGCSLQRPHLFYRTARFYSFISFQSSDFSFSRHVLSRFTQFPVSFGKDFSFTSGQFVLLSILKRFRNFSKSEIRMKRHAYPSTFIIPCSIFDIRFLTTKNSML